MSRTRYDWSELSPDILLSILEGLSIKDFHRARTICSNWYSISRTCKRPMYPWRILFNETYTLLIDPLEGELHEIQHPKIVFSEKSVLASCSNWLLMVNSRLHFYLVNLFTREKINLPSMESSLLGQETFQKKYEWENFIKRTDINSSQKQACLWINERTRDYVVAWSVKQHYLFTYKKGDESWSSLEGTKCMYMAYYNKAYKLYVYTSDSFIKIFDISGDYPNEIFQGNPYLNHPFRFVSKPGEYKWKQGVAVTNSGEVLMIVSLKGLEKKSLFYIYKMNLETCDWERVDSLGGEMLIFGHGVTIRAPVKDIDGLGIKSDSICFSGDDLWSSHFIDNNDEQSIKYCNCGVFDLATSTITWPKQFYDESLKSFWFVPGYA